MSGNRFVLDTNIVLYLLSGDDIITTFLQGTYGYISVISELELLGFPSLTDEERLKIKSFLNDCIVIELNPKIKEIYSDLRKKYKLKLADAVAAATSIDLGLPFISADTDFNKVTEMHFILYSR